MVWLIGCKGMLGLEIARQLTELKVDFCASGREVDITQLSSLLDFSADKKIDYIINCAAYNFVDKAESQEAEAFKVNQKGPENIALLAKKIGAKLIHISTDYVFDGKKTSPLLEDDPTNPISLYGKSKLLGEIAVKENLTEHYIIRTSWLYGFEGKNFVYTILKLINSKESIKVVNDQIGSPTFAFDLSNVIISIFQNDNLPYGIYNYSDVGQISWWEFAKEIQKIAIDRKLIQNLKCNIISSPSAQYPAIAKRPAYSVLSTKKIQEALNIKIPDWKESLTAFFNSSYFNKGRIL